jgi:hypothetical protein
VMLSRPLRLAPALVFASVATLALAIAAALDTNRIDDDAFMFVRYARNVVSTGHLAWNPGGPATYGVTSIAYTGLVLIVNTLLHADPAVVLVVSTLLCGTAFVVLLLCLAHRAGDAPAARAWGVAIAAAGLAWPAQDVAAHFVSGMDTALAVLYSTYFIWTARAFERQPSRRNALLFGATGGAALWVRPELLAFGLGVPVLVALLAKDPERTRPARLAALTAVAVAAALAGIAWLAFGSPVPLATYGKVLHGYGPDMRSVYAGFAAHQFALYARDFAPFAALALANLVLRLRAPGARSAALDIALTGGIVVVLTFHCVFVLPIMGDHQRFEYLTLPALAFLAVRGLHAIAAVTAEGAWRRTLGIVAVAGLAVCTVPAVRSVANLAHAPRLQNFGVLEHYRADWPSRMWARLDRVAQLPDDIVIATTEVGYPGVLNPRKTIIDLAGLNDTEFATHGFSADRLFARSHPDLFYLTTRHYAEIRGGLFGNRQFATGYELLQPPGGLVIALRRASPHYATLRAAITGP